MHILQQHISSNKHTIFKILKHIKLLVLQCICNHMRVKHKLKALVVYTYKKFGLYKSHERSKKLTGTHAASATLYLCSQPAHVQKSRIKVMFAIILQKNIACRYRHMHMIILIHKHADKNCGITAKQRKHKSKQ